MRVLFVYKEYLPKPTPGGLCIMNVQKALYERGVLSDVIMAGEQEGLYTTNDYGEVYSIRADLNYEKKRMNVLHYLWTRLPMVFTWPVPSNKRVNDYRRMIKQNDEKKHYDAIIGVMFPPDVCVACSAFNHFFLYELDSLINNPMYKVGIKKYLTARLARLEKKLFDKAELVIHLNNNKEFYSKEKYIEYAEKSVYSDIPNLVSNIAHKPIGTTEQIEENVIASDQLLLIYSGHLSKDYRSPTQMIDLMKRVSKERDIKVLFFSRGDCEDELRIAEAETNGIIKRMGYVSQDELRKYLDRADFLLDIGNCLSGEDYSVPSKIFGYMSEGKPIIHINGVNDSAIQYLEKYGLAINIGKETNIEDAARKTVLFMDINQGKRINFADVAKLFPQSTPEYTADLIIRQIRKRQKTDLVG